MLRSQGLTALGLLRQKQRLQVSSVFIILGAILLRRRNIRKAKLLLTTGLVLAICYLQKQRVRYLERRWHGDSILRFDSLDEAFCHHTIRFHKSDLWRISEALLLPRLFRLDNGTWTDNQEMLIVLLTRMASADTNFKLQSVLDIEMTKLSRIFKVSLVIII